jgi:hypothetical protein
MSFPFFLIPITTAPKRLVSIKKANFPSYIYCTQTGDSGNKNREQAMEGPLIVKIGFESQSTLF